MNSFRKMQLDAIKQGGFQVAMIRGPGQTSNQAHDNVSTEPQPTTNNEECRADLKKPAYHGMEAVCTPTKLDFDNAESLDELGPLSPYWYSQTTYGIIDAQILEKSGGKLPSD
ncbi:hypothetical protein L6452_37507 [Arctium lappa]|uniref:Uncharacterized protein n=1 Tax=Arctium lappa TaxID=4217 RepID=A0ACB8Y3W3_ARCLA|nr:hypothetical protein L6452_37507 [Arctium lappa]